VRKMTARLERLNRPGRLAFLYRQAVAALRKAVKVEPVRDTNLFTISARDFSPVGAAIIANTVSRSYQIFDLEQQMAELEIKYGEKHQIVQQLRDNIDHMVENLNGELLPDAEAIGPASVKIIEQAGVPMEPVGPSKLLVFLLAVVMSLFLGVMLAFMFEYMDQTFKTPFDVESSLQLPFLGYVIKRGMMDKSLIGNPRKLTPYGRTIQTLAEQLYLVMKDKQVKSTVVASCLRNEGSSVLTANLGIILSSKLHHNVLIIDANLRRPLQHKLFKIGEPAGLTQVVEGKLKLDKALVTLDTKLTLLPAGQTEFNPITLLDSGKMIAAIDELQSRHEIILIDAPPFRDYNDANLLAGIADGTVVVVSEGRTRRQVVQSAIAPLRGHGDRLLGVILNNRTYPIPRIIYDRF
ncbi:MAG: lipopolysaccharide biosynthesis protein, partial [Candidatus Omnitrophica bacterium]|nr:lipopolysaccharide biosynthesis protein [Candidatus Omnitrophota bacterium]